MISNTWHHGHSGRFAGDKDRDRGYPRDREPGHYHRDGAAGHGGYSGGRDRERPLVEPSATIVIKGLPIHTTEATVLAFFCNLYAPQPPSDLDTLVFAAPLSIVNGCDWTVLSEEYSPRIE